jgi:ABC-type Zn uptake system ZnuABC Zn-binding protein ZnuA
MRTWSLRGGVFLLLLMLGWGIGTALRHGRHEGWSPHHKKLRVLTTIFPLYDFARTVGGDAVEVRNLLPPGVDPHEFALSPGDISTVAEADVLIANGAGLDDFLTDALKKAEISGKPVIHCAEGLPLLSVGEGEPHAGHKEGDPHLWLDPQNARRL